MHVARCGYTVQPGRQQFRFRGKYQGSVWLTRVKDDILANVLEAHMILGLGTVLAKFALLRQTAARFGRSLT